MRLVNGTPATTVDAQDRGLAYGDGVFRTLRTRDGQPVWWRDQYARLTHDCSALGIACPDEGLLRSEVAQVALPGDGVVKITVTRGTGARGYAPPADALATRIIAAIELPAHALSSGDVRARWCDLKLARQPRLAGIKHLNRLENVLARAEWDDPAVFEGLLCDTEGWVVGGVMSNVFWAKDGALFTPELGECGVAGATRARLLRTAVRAGYAVTVVRQPRAAILAADEVVICNSVLRVRRVAQLDDAHWAGPAYWPPVLNALLDEETD